MCQLFECDMIYSLVVEANAIIAYNNRSATEAVPYFEQVRNQSIASFSVGVYSCRNEILMRDFVMCDCLISGFLFFLLLWMFVVIIIFSQRKEPRRKKKMGDICEEDFLPVIYVLFAIDYSLCVVI